MGQKKGWMSMNELLIGLPLQYGSSAILRAKITDAKVLRDTILGKRWTAQEAHAAGFVDEVVDNLADPGAVTGRAIELAEEQLPKARLGAWGGVKNGVYGWVYEQLLTNPPAIQPEAEKIAFLTRMEREKGKL
jgi:enoyl-CoA hydratase/carnithine racemase